ncbi:hypothetical protein JCM8097_005924 [Rhodosporidiobolus ruineniae]
MEPSTLPDPTAFTSQQLTDELSRQVAGEDVLGVFLLLLYCHSNEVNRHNSIDNLTSLEVAISAPLRRLDLRILIIEVLLLHGADPDLALKNPLLMPPRSLSRVVREWKNGGAIEVGDIILYSNLRNPYNPYRYAVVGVYSEADLQAAIQQFARVEVDNRILEADEFRVDVRAFICRSVSFHAILSVSIGQVGPTAVARVDLTDEASARAAIEDLDGELLLGYAVLALSSVDLANLTAPSDSPPVVNPTRRIDFPISFGAVEREEAAAASEANEREKAFPDDSERQRQFEVFLNAQTGETRDWYTDNLVDLLRLSREGGEFADKAHEAVANRTRKGSSRSGA